jgi:hypothetical protein
MMKIFDLGPILLRGLLIFSRAQPTELRHSQHGYRASIEYRNQYGALGNIESPVPGTPLRSRPRPSPTLGISTLVYLPARGVEEGCRG